MPNLASLGDMYCLKDKQPLYRVKDLFVTTFWFSRYRFWNVFLGAEWLGTFLKVWEVLEVHFIYYYKKHA
jgi:hypothetical protein